MKIHGSDEIKPDRLDKLRPDVQAIHVHHIATFRPFEQVSFLNKDFTNRDRAVPNKLMDE